MMIRGVRGAITVTNNDAREIVDATKELLLDMIAKNEIRDEDIASIFFTLTDDLNAEFPAVAARELGMKDVPLICAREISIEKAMKKCIRILIHINSTKAQKDIVHSYLREAVKLRPDLQDSL